MNTEIEAVFTDINPDEVRSKLKVLRAEQIYPERLMRRRIFDFPDLRLDKTASWVRLRDEGDKITLAFKTRSNETLHGMQEAESEVSDFDATTQVLHSIGLTDKAYQETKREMWYYNGCHIAIDTWPWIPTYIEVEGESEDAVKSASADLGFSWEAALFDSVDAIYQQH
ncbi:MAG TPA: CYTH domain-containing protein, partial [Candidatus Saccharimonadales bacterium]|nr:CYTH domain-containing protein [Candidatus Saccharimonadales bacterium]